MWKELLHAYPDRLREPNICTAEQHLLLGEKKRPEELFDGKSPLAELNLRLNGAAPEAHTV